MSDLAVFIPNLIASVAAHRGAGNNGAAIMRERGDANRQAILSVLRQTMEALGATEISKRACLTRETTNTHLNTLHAAGLIRRATQGPRAPWLITAKGR
jgi:predicted transcriptional regulator